MNNAIFLSVIIPVYNEARRIGRTLEAVAAYLRMQTYGWEIIVVNDGSRDATSDVVRGYQHQGAIMLIDNKVNRGKGFAVNQGMRAASGDIALFMDADNSTRIGEFEKMKPFFDRGYDIVIGSRRTSGAVIDRHQPVVRESLGKLFGLIVRMLFGFPYLDTQAGFKAFGRAARVIFQKQTAWRWAFDVELLVLARKMKLRIAETPITWRNDPDSRVTFYRMVHMLIELLRIRLFS